MESGGLGGSVGGGVASAALATRYERRTVRLSLEAGVLAPVRL